MGIVNLAEVLAVRIELDELAREGRDICPLAFSEWLQENAEWIEEEDYAAICRAAEEFDHGESG